MNCKLWIVNCKLITVHYSARIMNSELWTLIQLHSAIHMRLISLFHLLLRQIIYELQITRILHKHRLKLAFYRFQAIKGQPFASIMFAVTILLLGILDDYWSLFASTAAVGCVNGLMTMCFTLVPHDIVGTELYSTAMGVVNTMYGVGNSISGPVGGKGSAMGVANTMYGVGNSISGPVGGKGICNGRGQYYVWSWQFHQRTSWR